MGNNLDKILPILRFDIGSYYVQIIQRIKDGNTNNSLVCEWFITSEERLKFIFPAIESVCNQYNARCYMGVNPKRDEDISWFLLKNLVERVRAKTFKSAKIMSHAHNSCKGGVNYWVIDIDDMSINIESLKDEINSCNSKFNGNNVVLEIPSKTGLHLITHPFNINTLKINKDAFDVKKNASTILYCP